MGKGKKSFIDRKKAVTFHMVHRSQRDPLVADETAPQHVLVAVSKRKEEQRKYGILYDDDYDYLQHLKKTDQQIEWEYVANPNQVKKSLGGEELTPAPTLNLLSSVFASEYEEAEGMLNKAILQQGPKPDWDPDIVAALDDDFDFNNIDNQLEDDFMTKAMSQVEDGTAESEIDMDNNSESDDVSNADQNGYTFDIDNSEIMDRLAPLIHERRFADDETKSRFTEYSMSSSVIRRNEQLTLLDDRFERFYAAYDDPELGDLSMEEIEGSWNQKHPYVLGCFKEFKKPKKSETYNKEWDRHRVEMYRNVVDGEDDPHEELMEYEVSDRQDKKWDCESILSTYSNIYNRPKIIHESHRKAESKINIDVKTGLPTNVLHDANKSKLTVKVLAQLDESMKNHTGEKEVESKLLCAKSILSTLSVLSIRPKDETKEEKKERKRLLKEYRNERRIEKKANTQAFKEETKRQTCVKLNQHTNQNGSKIL